VYVSPLELTRLLRNLVGESSCYGQLIFDFVNLIIEKATMTYSQNRNGI